MFSVSLMVNSPIYINDDFLLLTTFKLGIILLLYIYNTDGVEIIIRMFFIDGIYIF